MKKITYLLMLVAFAFSWQGYGQCASVPSSNDGNGISSVLFGTTSFTSGGDITYEDFTATVVDVSAGTTANLQITFATGYTYDTNVWVDLNDDLTFDTSELLFDGVSSSSNPTTLNASFALLSSASLGSHKMRIGTADSGQSTPTPCYSGSYGVTIDMVINVTAAPSCLPPTSLTATSITATSADLGWTAGDSETTWNVEYGADGFTQGAGTMVTGTTTNPHALSGLTGNTAYDFYVQADCSGDTSTWVGPYSFTTACDAITSFPYLESFEGITSGVPDCWGVDGDAASSEHWSSTSSGQTGRGLRFNSYNAYYGEESRLTTQSMDLSSMSSVDLTFQYKYGSSSSSYDIEVFISSDGGSTYTSLGTGLYGSSSWSEKIYTIASGLTTNVVFKFVGTADWSNYAYLDEVSVSETPSCVAPTSLTATNITATNADLGWTAGGAETTWNVEYGETGFTQGAGTMVTGTTTNPHALSGLTANTAYDFYVQADCSGDTSGWVGPYSFTTACAAVATFSENFDGVSTGTLPDCWSKIVTSTSSYSKVETSTSYDQSAPNSVRMYASTDTSATMFLVSPGVTTLGSAYRLTLKAVVDDVACAYSVGTITDPTDSTTFTALYTNETLTATYSAESKIYDFSAYSGSDSYVAIQYHPSYYDTLYLDDMVWEAVPSCVAPTSLTATNITATSADLGWTAGGTETTWNVEYGADGFTQGAGTMVTGTTTNPHALSGLTANTAYDFYVQADCGGDTSTWVGPYSFTTPCAVVTSDYVQDFTTYLDACWSEATGLTSPSGTTSGWGVEEFAHTSSSGGGAVNFNIYGTGGNEWLITPTFDLSAGGYEINLDVALTLYNSTSSTVIDSDDSVNVMQSIDGGTTWTTIYTWDASNSPSNTGDNVTIDISAVTSATVKFALLALEGSTSSTDMDFHVDNFAVRVEVLSSDDDLELEEGFTFFPNPVNNMLNVSANNAIEQLQLVNMLGQVVKSVQPNHTSYQLDMTELATGVYFIKAIVNGTEGTYRVLKK